MHNVHFVFLSKELEKNEGRQKGYEYQDSPLTPPTTEIIPVLSVCPFSNSSLNEQLGVRS